MGRQQQVQNSNVVSEHGRTLKKKKRSNRRNKGFSQVGRTTRESKPGREGEGCWGMRRGKVMMVLWGGALDPSVPLRATLCPLCSPLLTQTLLSSLWIRVNHTIFGWDYVIDTQTMSTVPLCQGFHSARDAAVAQEPWPEIPFSCYCDNWCLQLHKAMAKKACFLTCKISVQEVTYWYRISDFVELSVGPKLW